MQVRNVQGSEYVIYTTYVCCFLPVDTNYFLKDLLYKNHLAVFFFLEKRDNISFFSFGSLSYDSSIDSSKTSSLHSAIQCFLLQFTVPYLFLKVTQ